MKDIERYLWEETGCRWLNVSPVYLNFKLTTNPFYQLCVFSPNPHALKPDYYIPENAVYLHNPGIFLEKYLNAKKALIQNMPAIEFDLDSLPGFEFIIITPLKSFKGTFKLTGQLLFQQQGSLSNFTIGKDSVSMVAIDEARNDLAKLITNSVINITFEEGRFNLSLESEVEGPLGTAAIELESANTFTAKYMPKSIKWQYLGWDIEGQLGFESSGSYTDNPNMPESAINSAVSNIGGEKIMLTTIEIAAIIALIVFTDGAGVALLAASGLGAGSLAWKLGT